MTTPRQFWISEGYEDQEWGWIEDDIRTTEPEKYRDSFIHVIEYDTFLQSKVKSERLERELQDEKDINEINKAMFDNECAARTEALVAAEARIAELIRTNETDFYKSIAEEYKHRVHDLEADMESLLDRQALADETKKKLLDDIEFVKAKAKLLQECLGVAIAALKDDCFCEYTRDYSKCLEQCVNCQALQQIEKLRSENAKSN